VSRTDAAPASLPAADTFEPSSQHNLLRTLVTTSAKSHTILLGAILIAGLALRVAWVSSVQPDPRDGRFDDSVWYYGTARHLADGDGYVYPLDTFCAIREDPVCEAWVPGEDLPPTALWAPGYPLLLAGMFSLPGDDVAAGRVLNIVASLLLIAGVYYLGSALWSRTAGLIAAAAIAFFPSSIFFSGLLLSETVFTAAAVGLLCLAVAWTLNRNTAWWKVFAIGLAAGCVGMLRPEGAFITLAVVAAWAAVHRDVRKVARYMGLLLLGMAIIYTPWVARNAIQLDSPVVGTTGAGQVLIQAHNPNAGGRPDIYAVVDLWNKNRDVPFPEREVRINNTGISDSVDYAVHHIPRELSLVPHRLAWFYRGDASGIAWTQDVSGSAQPPLSDGLEDVYKGMANVYYYAIAVAMVIGLAFWYRRASGKHLIVFGPFVAYTVMWALFFVGEDRYHFALLPVFCVLAGIGIAAAMELLTQNDSSSPSAAVSQP
jgi:4-amino-4-deoxy-L-arabinose transferase-like glycosyltransferase